MAITLSTLLNYLYSAILTWIVTKFGQRIIWANKKPDGSAKEPWPVSPSGLPYFTQAFSIFNKESYHALTRWSKELGDFFSVQIGQKKIIVLNNADLVRTALIEKEQLNSSRMLANSAEILLTNNAKTVYTAPFSLYWSRIRRAIYICIGKIYTSSLAQFCKQQASTLILGIDESVKKEGTLSEKQLRQLVDLVAMDSALALVLGKQAESRDPATMLTIIQKCHQLEAKQTHNYNRIGQFFPVVNSVLDAVNLFSKDTNLTSVRNELLELFSPWFEPIYNQNNAATTSTISFDKKKSSSVDERVESIAKSLLHVEPSKNDPEPVQLKKDEVLTNVVHITLHAYTYLASALFTLIQRLATEPTFQERLADPSLSQKDQSDLAFAFVCESLRVDTPNRLLAYAPRADYEFEFQNSNYRVDMDSEIVVNVDAIHKDSRYYDEPEKFNPDRFLGPKNNTAFLLEMDRAMDKKVVAKDHLAFGAGRRICLGKHVSEELLAATLINIANTYTLLGGDVENKIESKTNVWGWTGRTETKGSRIDFVKRQQ